MSNALITGASRGIGAATARLFAREGWNVAVNYNRSRDEAEGLARELSGLGVRAVPIQGDISVPEGAERMVQEAETALGGLDAVICNAGVALPQQLMTDTTVEQWRQVAAVDLDGVFYTLRAAIPGMVRQKRGAVVTVSSMWGIAGGSCE
ncbi:MAG: SDR family NAD(P)-dependent oxidoreductase, partial [Lawsonibacter sp.]|nr:SDR family NAD(P)-dependent oxidoreductase [Lawsonibacter sp.]